METQGLVTWLVWLLTIRAVVQAAAAYQSLPNKQVTAAEAAKAFALEWRMEATAHIASLMVRDQQCKGDPTNCDLQEGASDAIETLSKWAVGDKGWERLLSSVSLYAIARHAYQEAEYDEAIIALEESLALRLFAYADQKTLDRWQQGLVMPGSLFRRQKMDLANTLVLRSDCLVQLAREQRDVDDLTEAMELLQLATALLKGGEELVPDSVAAFSRRAATIASVAAELLPQLKTTRIREVLEHHGISCTGCNSKTDYLLRLVPLLRLPVRVVSSPGTASSSKASSSSSSSQQQQALIEPLKDPFNSHATALLKKPQEHVAQYMQRVFFRLLTLVPADYLAELEVACRRQDAKGRCISYLPQWVTAQAITIDKRTGVAHISGPGAYAQDNRDLALLEKAAPDSSSSSDSSAGSCGSSSGSGATVAGPQLNSEPLFIPGDAGDKSGLPAAEPHNRAGVELCGFLHIRAIPPGVNLPTTGGSLTPQQQKALKDIAADSVAAGTAVNSPFKGVYYYFYADVPALVDRIINTFDPEEADFLFEQLDGLTAAKSLGLAGRLNTPQQKNCNEQILLEGKASPTCSVLAPNIGSCARAPLKPPRRKIPMQPIPQDLGLPPTIGTYTPRFRTKAPPPPGWSGRSLGDSSSGSDDEDSGLGGSDGLGCGNDRGLGPGGHGCHRAQRHHHSFSATDRELSDRQLQEQMAKLARDAGRRDRDDPLVPLTLAGCAVASFGLYLASKRRRRSGLSSSGANSSAAARLVLLGLGTGRLKSSSGGNLATAGSGTVGSATGAAAAAGAGTVAGPGPPAHAEDCCEASGLGSTKQKRQVVAALRVAMNNTADTGTLAAALAEAELADLDEAGLLQRARVLLDKRRKKDQAKAVAEKARLRAQKKEEARKGRKAAAAKQAAAAAVSQGSAGLANCSSSSGRISDSASHVSAGDLESDTDSRQAANGMCGIPTAVGSKPQSTSGLWMRFWSWFGYEKLGTGDRAASAAGAAAADGPCWDNSGGSSTSLSRSSSSGACAAESGFAGAAAGATGAQEFKDSSRKQQRQSSSSSGVSSNSKHEPVSNSIQSCNSHPIEVGACGSSFDEATSLGDVPVSSSSPTTAPNATAAAAASTKPSSSKRGKGKDRSSNQQSSKITGFQEVEEVPGWTKAPREGVPSKASVVKAVLDPFTAAAAKAASHPLLSTPVKGKNKGKQAAAVHAAVANGTAAVGASPAKKLEQHRGMTAAASSTSVTPPVTPPATAVGTAAGAAGRTNGTPKHAGAAGQNGSQHQQLGAVPAGWVRRSAVSDDGSSSRPSTAGSLQQQGSNTGATTPSKPKLNPKATPYNPLAPAAKAAAAAAAGHPAAATFGGYATAGMDWQQQNQQQQMPEAPSPGYPLPIRGASPIGGAGAGLLGPDGHQYQHVGMLLNGSHSSSNGVYQGLAHGVPGHQGLAAGLGPADSAMDVSLHGNSLMSYRSADQPGGYPFDQGLTSPNQHHSGGGLPDLAGLVSPQQHVYDRVGMPPVHQQVHQQQLLELLSAASPGEAAAAYGAGLASAGGSAPINLGPGSSMESFVAAAAAANAAQRGSYSSVPEQYAVHAAGGHYPTHGPVPGFEGLHSAAGLYSRDSAVSGPAARKGPGVLPLSLDDDQLPPGFSAEDYSTPSSELVNHANSGYHHHPASTLGLDAAAVASPNSIPTTAPLGVFAAGNSVWAPLAATAGNAASTVAAGVRSLWPATLATTTALPTDYSSAQHSYSRSQDLEVEVAAAATSANVAELVLGSSPSLSSVHVGAGAADAQMSKLAKEIMAIVAE